MNVYVIDASVALRFLLVEDLSDMAELVLEDFLGETVDLKAPELAVYEVGNTLGRAVKQRLINLDEAAEKLSYYLRLRIGSVGLDEGEDKEALRWGAKNDATFYDSVYVEASKKIGATLVTADGVLYEKALGEVPVLHLKDYKK